MSSNPNIGRFFSPKGALIAGGVFAIGCVLALVAVHGVVVEHRIHVGFSVATLFFLVTPLLLVPTLVLRRGCKPCGVKLAEHAAAYPAEAYEHLLHALSQPPGPAVTQLAAHRLVTPAHHRTSVELDYCPRCRRVGVVRVSEEVWNDQFYEAKRSSGDISVSDHEMTVPMELVGLPGPR